MPTNAVNTPATFAYALAAKVDAAEASIRSAAALSGRSLKYELEKYLEHSTFGLGTIAKLRARLDLEVRS